ncbi:hypothetical protein FV232_24730 [Methylobacterium sp. WL30]|uniref:hypothetical protein n=1 Tax=unclassified Methylobacterium TaxID=2615210 RepID=UPI0011C7C919|nr:MULTISPECIES: hypothetical protein [unclassified Methylobacterium]TXN41422.1 hypothetical protein FV225_02745 [Methylobacterium sp. WL93]TXN49804.1 hypothetical protein FV227_15035 [Methylobacterium sp. WL119]TXN62768.1 hypothetical protein FV232_24730 [Methylobacterium sp. WL30]
MRLDDGASSQNTDYENEAAMAADQIPIGRGVKQGENPAQFQDSVLRPNIVPDRASPTVASYFRVPPVWIGEQPTLPVNQVLPITWGHETILRLTMACGIKIRVQRDGLFAFDFTDFLPATYTIIPGYIHPEAPHRVPKEHTAAEQQAENIAIFRAQIMNAHQACLTTAEALVRQRSAAMGFPVNAWNTFKSISLDAVPPYYDDTEDERAVARNVYNNSYEIRREHDMSRRLLELDVVAKSFDLLDQVIASSPTAVAMVEGAYMAASRSVEKRFGESVVLGWTVCEQLVSVAWQRLLDSKKSTNEHNIMTGKRIDKLTGRDYTASVMTEVLELSGVLSADVYNYLEKGRKARNAWAHSMQTPNDTDVNACISGIKILFKQLLDIDLALQTGGRGGVPQWPIWMLHRSVP